MSKYYFCRLVQCRVLSSSFHNIHRLLSTQTSGAPRQIKTGIVMMNMGGPATLDEVEPFLTRLFSDNDIIKLGRFQSLIGPLIAKRRSSRIREQYASIGGGSPIGKWTRLQGEGMCERLDRWCPQTAPHKAYTAFRYAEPLTEEALMQMKADGVQRAVAFSQYPQFSCTTTGSSFNHLLRESKRLGVEHTFDWSIIDRFPTDATYIQSVAHSVRLGLQRVPENVREKCVIVFSSHSLPLMIVKKGDQYPQEMAASVQLVMNELQYSHAYVHAWQSKVGFLPWIGPSMEHVLQGLAARQSKHVLIVPLGFTSDHIETLYELDVEYAETAHKAGMETYVRAPALNDDSLFVDALAGLVQRHLAHAVQGESGCSKQYILRCAHCVNPLCRPTLHQHTQRHVPMNAAHDDVTVTQSIHTNTNTTAVV